MRVKLSLLIISSVLILTSVSLAVNSEMVNIGTSNTTQNLSIIRINSTPMGAEVWLDGIYSGQLTPSKFTFKNAENHSFELRLYGYDWQTINLNTSNSVNVFVNLSTGQDFTRGSVTPHVDVRIDSYPQGAEVYRDGKNTGETTPYYEPAGVYEAHNYDVRKEGYKDYSMQVITDGDKTIEVPLNEMT